MKILMVLESSFPPDLRVENEIDALHEAGHEIHLACRELVNCTNTKSYPGVLIHRKKMSDLVYKSSVGCLKISLYFNWWKKYLREILDKESFDAVHLHDLTLSEVIIGLRRDYAFKFVLDLHENYPVLLMLSEHVRRFPANILFDFKQWQSYERDAVQAADQVIVVIDEAKERILKLGANKDKITVVSNTYPEYKFKEIDKIKENSFIIFYGGGITIHRGLQYVVSAIGLLKSKYPDIVFRIFGNGRYLDDLKSNAINSNNNIEFKGWVPSDELMDELSKADVAIIPHVKSEHTDTTIPHKLFQYMAKGIPVLTSDCDPLARIVREEGCGFVYTYDDIQGLANKIEKLYKDYDLRRAMSDNGISGVREKYLWKYDAEKLSKLYNTL